MHKLKINHLLILLELYPNENWNYNALSENPNITWDFIKANLDKPWNFEQLSRTQCITWEIVQQNPNILWSYYYLSQNPNITWDIVKLHPTRDWDSISLTINPNINWNIIKANPNHTFLGKNNKWNWGFMTLSSKITLDIIKQNPNIPWNSRFITGNPNITWDEIQQNPDIEWDYNDLSRNSNMTWDIIKANPNKKWNYSILTNANSNITFDIIRQNPDKKWDLYPISTNLNITLNDVLQFHYHWMFNALLSNPEIFDFTDENKSWKLMQEYPNKFGSFIDCSNNPSITWKTIHTERRVKWYFSRISKNKFNKDPFIRKKIIIEKYFKKWRKFVNHIKKMRKYWKSEFDASLDLLKLRIADITERNFENKSPKILF
jgi:hypothetical protein